MATIHGKTLTIVLGGGRGTRLYPLTKSRAKPAVPLGAKYRLVDIPISNAINSGLREICVLTQFNSASLNAHLAQTYRFDIFTNGYVEVLAAEQTDESLDWFQGTADAVRRHLHRFLRVGVENILILSGDHLYRMNYQELIDRHVDSGADITVSTIPVRRDQCDGFGVLACDAAGRITSFREKPQADEDLSAMAVAPSLRQAWQMGDADYLASMGVYVFKPSVLEEVLRDPSHLDFGKDILPAAIRERPVSAFLFRDYWEDIGTISAFYEANMGLCGDRPIFRFYVPEAPIFTRPRILPPTLIRDAVIHQSIVAEGSLLFGARISQSIIGLRSLVQEGATIESSIIMGADFYELDERRRAAVRGGLTPVGVGAGASIKRAIIDKNARIGAGAVIHGAPGRPDEDHRDWSVRDGIVIVAKNATIPPGAVL